LQVNVTGQTPGISSIQNLQGWDSCSAAIGLLKSECAMDGDYAQQPYDVWLDEVSLNGY
jgi:hypothetical protein